MRKAIGLFGFILILMTAHVSSSATDESVHIDVSIDVSLRTITIQGEVNTNKKEEVAIILYRLNEQTISFSKDSFSEIDQITTNDDGSFVYTATLPDDAVGGWYEIKVGTFSAMPSYQTSTHKVYYPTQAEISACFSDITKPDVDYADFFDTYSDVLGININSHLGIMTQICNIFDGIRLTTYSEILDIATDYYAALSIALINSQQAQDLPQTLIAYGNYIGVELDKGFAVSQEEFCELLENSAKALDGFATIPQLKQAIQINELIIAINHANRTEVGNILTEYHDLLDIDITSYEKLGAQAIEVNKVLVNRNFKSITSIKDEFERKVKELSPAPAQNNSNGSYSGSGRAGGAISNTPPVMEIETSSKEETDTHLNHTFSDLEDVPWAKEAISALYALNSISGITNEIFSPHDCITREQFVKILITSMGLYAESDVEAFNDTERGEWYYSFVACAKQIGLVKGDESNNFGVGQQITRQDAATMILRSMRIKGTIVENIVSENPFADHNQVSDYAREAVDVMKSLNIINGVGDNLFEPLGNTTRAQASVMIYRVLLLNR